MTNTTEQLQAEQEANQLCNRIASFFDNYQIGSLLNRSGIRKLKGATALQLFSGIFMLAFEGTNFFRGIVLNACLDFKKDAAYDLLRNPCHNWRGFMQKLVVRAVTVLEALTDEDREKVLIFDEDGEGDAGAKTT